VRKSGEYIGIVVENSIKYFFLLGSFLELFCNLFLDLF